MRQVLTSDEIIEQKAFSLLESGAVPWEEPKPDWKQQREAWENKLAMEGGLIRRRHGR